VLGFWLIEDVDVVGKLLIVSRTSVGEPSK